MHTDLSYILLLSFSAKSYIVHALWRVAHSLFFVVLILPPLLWLCYWYVLFVELYFWDLDFAFDLLLMLTHDTVNIVH